MRSKLLTLDFYRSWCSNIYGKGVWPFVKRVNYEFGGLDIAGNNIYMTNGNEGILLIIKIHGDGQVYKKTKEILLVRLLTVITAHIVQI
jgi:hypothetical protein